MPSTESGGTKSAGFWVMSGSVVVVGTSVVVVAALFAARDAVRRPRDPDPPEHAARTTAPATTNTGTRRRTGQGRCGEADIGVRIAGPGLRFGHEGSVREPGIPARSEAVRRPSSVRPGAKRQERIKVTSLGALLAHPGVVEELVLSGPASEGVGFLALHGGLESGTAEIARAAAERTRASLYAVIQPDDLAWHIPSHRMSPLDSPKLASFLAHSAVVVSIHGYGRRDLPTALLVGGGDRSAARILAGVLRAALPAYDVRDDVATIPEGMRGLHPRNPVNLSGGGVQLEVPHRARNTRPGRAEFAWNDDSRALVDALADFVDAVSTPA